MPRPSWKGVLRLSLVTCPIYLMPATVRTKAIRLNQVWVPQAEPSKPDYEEDVEESPRPAPRRAAARMELPVESAPAPEHTPPATRISLRPHDPYTGAEVEREEVVKGYEYDRGQFVTFSSDELKALDIESTGAIDLATFVLRAEVDPLYFNVPYYVYPDGWIAVEAFQVLREAMTASQEGIAGSTDRQCRPTMCNDFGNRIPYDDYLWAFSQTRIPVRWPTGAPNLERRQGFSSWQQADIRQTT